MKSDRRTFVKQLGAGVVLTAGLGFKAYSKDVRNDETEKRGRQRLSVAQLQQWEKACYGMFIHFGMSTFVENELPDGRAPARDYAPDKLDVDQWVSVARDAGMSYAVLTAKHVAGHCLWPTKHTDYSVANSSNKTDVVGAFVTACQKRGVKPALYYCSWDNHNRFGSKTPSDGGWAGMNAFPKNQNKAMPPYTTSLYHNFQTAQITELLQNYGPLFEIWIDIPGVLGRGYRTYLYNYIAGLQPDIVIMMNSGFGDGTAYNEDYAWPSDLIAIERDRPSAGFSKWRTIAGGDYYLPGEHCDPIGKEWFHVPGDAPRSDAELIKQFEQTRKAGVNFLLDVPPNKSGVIPTEYVESLNRLRKNANL